MLRTYKKYIQQKNLKSKRKLLIRKKVLEKEIAQKEKEIHFATTSNFEDLDDKINFFKENWNKDSTSQEENSLLKSIINVLSMIARIIM